MEILDYTGDLKAEDGRGDISLRLAEIYSSYQPPDVLEEMSTTYTDGPTDYIVSLVTLCNTAFVAVEDTQIIGAAFVNPPNHDQKIISELFAHSAEDQKEVMRALLLHIIEHTKASQATILLAYAANQIEKAFYEEAGFVKDNPDDEISPFRFDVSLTL